MERCAMYLGVSRRQLIYWLGFLSLFLSASEAFAVPSFASQTGAQCSSCHISGFSTLTQFGRVFKLNAYGLGENKFPFVVGGVASMTKNGNASPAGEYVFKENNRLFLQRASAYFAGKIGDNAGAFVNWNYDGVERRGKMEMVDVRYAGSTSLAGKNLVLGVTLNNNPTVSDIYNSTPAFGFPQLSPNAETAVPSNAMAQIDMGLASQVAGVAAYAWWNDSLYAELGAYRTADKIFSVLRAGVPRGSGMDAAATIKSGAPYWRLAYEQNWGNGHSLAAGTFGLLVDRYPDPSDPSGPADGFRDIGLDAQYQYLGDEHRVTSGLTWIREKQLWRASFDPSGMGGMRDGPDGRLTTLRAYAGYIYRQQYGATVGYFSTRGNIDQMLYNTGEPITGSANGSPDATGGLIELSYIPQQNVRLALRYTAYSKFNGAKIDYDGFGRNARDNNQLYFYTWFLF